MSENIQVAQSYAKAVHELCANVTAAESWSAKLAVLATVAENPDMARYLADVSRSSAERTQGFLTVAASELDPVATNLVRLLGENGRLAMLPAIAAQFELLRDEAEQRISASVTSAFPLTDNEIQQIKAALSKRLNRSVVLQQSIDANLIAGAVIRAGDWVIDGSARGGIDNLATQMSR
ncbi:F0F1 ATP synthase subunit delta [Halothiobacillus sp. DCM-1]|uniref:F0F1 ATP synthase subunit delta n=1 Tax=Halothiobacillus sp. DCM-1 TaxID=3112558 RepID=UPI003253A687